MREIDKIALGIRGEDIALEYLLQKGYRLLTRNYRCAVGEIDIVCKDKDYMVFIEVRSKTSERYGSPEESLTIRKINKIKRVAEYFLMQSPKLQMYKVRFDFIAVRFEQGSGTDQVRVGHYVGVF